MKAADLRASGLLGLFVSHLPREQEPQHFNQRSWYLQCPVLEVQKNEPLLGKISQDFQATICRPGVGAVVKASKVFTVQRGVKAAEASTWGQRPQKIRASCLFYQRYLEDM